MARIGLSTVSVYPESSAHAFSYAATLGYDSIEVMVGIDALSQQTSAIKQLSEHHGVPVSAVHAPCLLFTQRVWGTEPWGKLERSAEMAQALGADVVVVHPPFRWQKQYAASFVDGIAALETSTGLKFAVENMYPWRASSKRGMEMYLPGWDPSYETYANTTIDLSHASIAHDDVIDMAKRMGERLRHIHLTDGTGSAKDEHLVPGRGSMKAAEFLQHLASVGFDGEIVLEINTRKCKDVAEREAHLRQPLLLLARSAQVKKLVSTMPVSSGIVHNYVPGETTEAAVGATSVLEADGLRVTLDFLGEDTMDAEQAEATVQAYLSLLEQLSAQGLTRDA